MMRSLDIGRTVTVQFSIAVKYIFLLLCYVSLPQTAAQNHSTSSIFTHNDYAQPKPFFGAYENRVGYMEADVFLKDGELFVAHLSHQIKKEKTLRSLYLIPLQQAIANNNGWAYRDSSLTLTLMIDLKTEGMATVNKLVEQLQGFQELLACPTLKFLISGNGPDPSRWDEMPSFISFDGRPGIPYTQDQLSRIALISTNFNNHVRWNGQGELSSENKSMLITLINEVHRQGKKIRFWAAPDFENGWRTLMSLGVDVMGTDDVEGLVRVLKK